MQSSSLEEVTDLIKLVRLNTGVLLISLCDIFIKIRYISQLNIVPIPSVYRGN